MADHNTSIADLRQRVAEFVAARDWEQFHVPKNLSVAVAVEAAELMEHFQWLTHEQAAVALQDEGKRAAVADELADVLIYVLSLANALDVDVSAAVLSKLERNEHRFPAQEWRGRARGVGDAGSRTTS
ncbi:MAG: nucleotide pyrophosphohydrolase [Anaerolineae bacterium]